jgi:hypothetical protein
MPLGIATRWCFATAATVLLATLSYHTISILPAAAGGGVLEPGSQKLMERVVELRSAIRTERRAIDELMSGVPGYASLLDASDAAATPLPPPLLLPRALPAGVGFVSEGSCDEWACTCQGMSDVYGTTHATKFWGSASTSAREWWIARKCETAPKRAAITAAALAVAAPAAPVAPALSADSPTLLRASSPMLRRGSSPFGSTGDGVVALSGADAERILRGDAAPPPGRGSKAMRFVPGSLPTMAKKESLGHCHVDTSTYREHFQPRSSVFASLSAAQHNLALFPVQKSGSSTVRHIMKTAFGAQEANHYDWRKSTRKHIAFVRKPLSRFYSQYDEMFVREPPWDLGSQARMPPAVRGYNAKITSYEHYMSLFCNHTEAELKADRALRNHCNQSPSAESGELSALVDKFLAAWDGLSVFDIHLRLQTSSLSDIGTGKMFRIDELHDIRNSNAAWKSIASRFGVDSATISSALIRGRSYPRRFNTTRVSEESVRRICRYAALDYCCLNFALPPECAQGAAGVACELTIGATGKHIVPYVDEALDALAAARRDARRRVLRR